MKLIKLALLSFLLLFIVVTIMSLFIPSHVRISRATEIGAPVDSIRENLSNPQRWRSWYPAMDSAILYSENSVVRGMLSPDSLKKVIIDQVSDTAVTTLFITPGRKPVKSGWTLHSGSAPNTPTTVQWYMDFNLKWYPWEKFASLVFEKTYGPMLESGLGRLKFVTETRNAPAR